MFDQQPGLTDAIRDRFAHVDTCPIQGERVFFENAGGALTLKSVVETSTQYAAIPDNQGRDNPMSKEQVRVIDAARAAMMTFLNAKEGQVFFGESGTELLFRMISNAIIESPEGGSVIGTTLEHPASRSAALRWAKIAGKSYISVPHDDETGSVEASDYAALVQPDTRVATIIHASPVTGMGVDVAAISQAIRAVSPDCLIIVDGIQHAAHGQIDIDSYGIDGYAISPYKMFSRHGYGVAWISDRLTAMPHDSLIGGPEEKWELGTRDTGAYATLANVIEYLDWLGGQFSDSDDLRTRLEAAGTAIHAQEQSLTDAMLHGTGNLKGLADMPEVEILGGVDNPRREGLVSCRIKGMETAEVIQKLSQRGIRVHIRKADYYSSNVLTPLGLPDCIRVSMCHYNTTGEVGKFLTAMREIIEE